HVADEGEHLDLVGDRDALVALRLPVEVAEDGVAERADAREVRSAQAALTREPAQPLEHLVARLEDENERLPAGVLMDQAFLHRLGVYPDRLAMNRTTMQRGRRGASSRDGRRDPRGRPAERAARVPADERGDRPGERPHA